MKARTYSFLGLAMMVGCAQMERDCSSCNAESFGADWVIVQVDLHGQPFRCWELRNTSVSNEHASDGIWWRDPHTQNLVHISGLYNRVQVVDGRWDAAFHELGLTADTCATIRNRFVNVETPR